MPELLTVATKLLLLLHEPPLTVGVKVMVLPEHTVEGPDIVPADAPGVMVTTNEAVRLPQLLLTVYRMVSTPAVIPTTAPDEDTVALPLVALHVPPVTEADSVVPDPVHILLVPDMVGVVGNAFTAMPLVANTVPQVLTMV